MINKNETLRTATGEFSGKASKLSTVLEIAIAGDIDAARKGGTSERAV